MRVRAALGAVVFLLVVGPTAGGAATSSGLWGVVMRGPITPVCVAERPCSAPAKHVTLVFSRDGQVVGRARSSTVGHYRISLRPGIYTVALTTQATVGRGLEPTSVVVRAARYRHVNFSIDTGIR